MNSIATETMTAITSTQVQVEVSQPRRSPLTVAEKARVYGCLIQWTLVDGDPFSLIMESPNSGKFYKVTLNPATGQVRCSCPCTGVCYHELAFAADWKPLMMDAAKASRASQYSVAAVSRPAPVSAATFAADWGN